MLTVEDIPEDLAGAGVSEGVRLRDLAATLEARVQDSLGTDAVEAGRCLVQASNQLRSSRVGVQVFNQAPAISGSFGEQQQYVKLAGSQLAVVSAASAIDLCVAALVRLTGNQQREFSLGQIVQKKHRGVLESLPPAHRKWVIASNDREDVSHLMAVRHRLVHRPVSLNVQVVVGESHTYSYNVDGERVVADPARDYAVAVDRFISVALMLCREPGA